MDLTGLCQFVVMIVEIIRLVYDITKNNRP